MGFPLSLVTIPKEIAVIAIPVAVTADIATGYLGLFVAPLAAYGWLDPRPLFASLYLYASLTTYFMDASQSLEMNLITAAYALLTIHTSLSILVVAVWYILSAKRRASGILHAARGEN